LEDRQGAAEGGSRGPKTQKAAEERPDQREELTLLCQKDAIYQRPDAGTAQKQASGCGIIAKGYK
jgi:hypothetical protein